MANNDVMIEAQGLSKFYGEFAAVQDVSFTVPKGQVCAFLGPNGAGKSTTMKMLSGFLAPCVGEARIAGHDVSNNRLAAADQLGYLPENGPLYAEMTPKSFLLLGSVAAVSLIAAGAVHNISSPWDSGGEANEILLPELSENVGDAVLLTVRQSGKVTSISPHSILPTPWYKSWPGPS